MLLFQTNLSGHEITKAYSGEGYEAEVSRVEVRPPLPLLEQECTGYYVRSHQENAQPDRNRLQLEMLIAYGILSATNGTD